MELQINITPDGMQEYPMHTHKTYEIMHYLEGTGYLRTAEGSIPFQPGTIIAVPPGLSHGSVSANGFRNISIGSDFEHLLCFDAPVVFTDNPEQEGTRLIRLLYENRFGNEAYRTALCKAYLHFLLQSLQQEERLRSCIRHLVQEISQNAWQPNLHLTEYLHKTGYAEDYIRDCFRKSTGKTPTQFLTEVRIKRACYLIDIYHASLSLADIAEQCGYTDYVYFSKKFKELTGTTPSEYKRGLSGH